MKIPKDKQLHIGAGLVLGVVGALAFPGLGLALGVVAGAAKELYDAYHRERHTPEFLDLIATVGGAALGEVVVFFLLV